MRHYQAGSAHDFASARAEGTGLLATIPGCGLSRPHGHTPIAGAVATCQIAATLCGHMGLRESSTQSRSDFVQSTCHEMTMLEHACSS